MIRQLILGTALLCAAAMVLAGQWPWPLTNPDIAMPCNTLLMETIDHPLESKFFTFDAVDGEMVSLAAKDEAEYSGTFNSRWILRNASSGLVCASFSNGQHIHCGPLFAAGSPYRIEMYDYNFNGTGSFTIHLQRLTSPSACDKTQISCGERFLGRLQHRIDNDLFGFCVADSTTVRIGLTNVAGSTQWHMCDASGADIKSTDCTSLGGSDFYDCGPLSASGSPYRLEAYASSGHTSYSFQFDTLAVSGECVPCLCPELELELQTVNSSADFLDCHVSAGNEFLIEFPGDVRFVAWYAVTLEDGFSVGPDAKFTAAIGVP